MYMCPQIYTQVPIEAGTGWGWGELGIRTPRAGVTGGCESRDMSAELWSSPCTVHVFNIGVSSVPPELSLTCGIYWWFSPEPNFTAKVTKDDFPTQHLSTSISLDHTKDAVSLLIYLFSNRPSLWRHKFTLSLMVYKPLWPAGVPTQVRSVGILSRDILKQVVIVLWEFLYFGTLMGYSSLVIPLALWSALSLGVPGSLYRKMIQRWSSQWEMCALLLTVHCFSTLWWAELCTTCRHTDVFVYAHIIFRMLLQIHIDRNEFTTVQKFQLTSTMSLPLSQFLSYSMRILAPPNHPHLFSAKIGLFFSKLLYEYYYITY